MEETNSEEIAVSDTAGAAGARGDEEVDISVMSADELQSLIVCERRERAAAKPLTATSSIVTQGEPGPLTLRGQTGVFSPSETQAKTIPALTPIADQGAGDDQVPTSGMTSKASLTVKPGVGGSDTALPGGVFRAGVETAPVFVPATSVKARSAADTAGVSRVTGFSMRNVRDPVRWDAEARIPSGQGSRPPAPSFFGDTSDQRFMRNNNNDHEVERLGVREGLYLALGASEGLYPARAETQGNRECYGNMAATTAPPKLRLASDESSSSSRSLSPRCGAPGRSSPDVDQDDSGAPGEEWRLSQKHKASVWPELSVHNRRLTRATRQLQRSWNGPAAATPATTETKRPVYNGKFVWVGAVLARQGTDAIFVSHIADDFKSYVVGTHCGNDPEADNVLLIIGSKPLDLRTPQERLRREKAPFTGDRSAANNYLDCMELLNHLLQTQEQYGFDPDGVQQWLLVNLAGTVCEMIARTPLLFESILYLVNRYLGDTECAKAMAVVSEVKQQNGKSIQEFALCLEQLSMLVQLKEQRAKWILVNVISAQWKHDNPNLVVYLCNWESNPRLPFLEWKNNLKRVLHEEVVSRREVVRHKPADHDG
jgi:hypothetical protein